MITSSNNILAKYSLPIQKKCETSTKQGSLYHHILHFHLVFINYWQVEQPTNKLQSILSGWNPTIQCAPAIAGPRAWNNLPVDLRLSRTFSTFKTHLKSHLFNISFPSVWLYQWLFFWYRALEGTCAAYVSQFVIITLHYIVHCSMTTYHRPWPGRLSLASPWSVS